MKNQINEIKKLEEQLKEKCLEKNLEEIGGFTFQFDSESGRVIMYVKDMSIEETSTKEFYDKNSPHFDPEYKDIKWPYTGFVQGNVLGWNPISIHKIVEWIDNSPVYTVERFINHFLEEVEELD